MQVTAEAGVGCRLQLQMHTRGLGTLPTLKAVQARPSCLKSSTKLETSTYARRQACNAVCKPQPTFLVRKSKRNLQRKAGCCASVLRISLSTIYVGRTVAYSRLTCIRACDERVKAHECSSKACNRRSSGWVIVLLANCT